MFGPFTGRDGPLARMSDQPSIGRIVHYVSHGSPVREDGTQTYTSECRAAVITQIFDEGLVALCVLNPSGIFFHEDCLLDEADHRGGTWHWPERV
jgi:hypothetical protein